MRPRDLALALLVVAVWGVNFAVIKTGVAEVPPLLLGALRFLLAACPAVFLLRAPKLPLRLYLAYGLSRSIGGSYHQELDLLTMFAALWLKESWRSSQLVGLLLAACGLALIGSAHGVSMPLLGFLLTVAAASLWAAGNIVTRAVAACGPINQLAFVVWASLVPPLPFLALSLLIEGRPAIAAALSEFSLRSFAAVAYLAWAATLLGYGLWTRLLSRYPANQVAPFSLLVPVVGLTTGWLVFDEVLRPVHLAGGALLMLGLAVNLFTTRLLGWARARP